MCVSVCVCVCARARVCVLPAGSRTPSGFGPGGDGPGLAGTAFRDCWPVRVGPGRAGPGRSPHPFADDNVDLLRQLHVFDTPVQHPHHVPEPVGLRAPARFALRARARPVRWLARALARGGADNGRGVRVRTSRRRRGRGTGLGLARASAGAPAASFSSAPHGTWLSLAAAGVHTWTSLDARCAMLLASTAYTTRAPGRAAAAQPLLHVKRARQWRACLLWPPT